MADFSTYTADALLNHLFRNITLTSPTTVYMALEGTAGELPVADGYARQAITFDPPVLRKLLNTSTLVFAAVGGDWLPVVAGSIWDAASGGNRLAGTLVEESRTITAGLSIVVSPGDVTITL